MWNMCSKFGTWPLMDPFFQNGAIDVRIFYGKQMFAMSLNRFLDKLEHEEQFDSADIYINPPIDESIGIIREKSNTEDTDEEEDKYISEENEEPASKEESEVPKSIRTV
ncbi:hypothetical protein HHI36_011367 [Cryptolaemus montrouzieri]|uniref:Uncharacterized protein n=1 Tax=Cryptolaemus montrouzieri TaxID=559131 RepID=A0ABD2MLG5_9CUCU